MVGRHAFLLCASAVLALAATPHLFRQSSNVVDTQSHKSVKPSKLSLDDTPLVSEGKAAIFGRDVQLRKELGVPARLTDLDILFVLDPNFYLCWELVSIDEKTKQTLIPWIASLKDAFTATQEHPTGLELQIPEGHHKAKELRDSDFDTFRELADATVEGNSSTIPLPSNLLLMYQAVTSNLTLADLGLMDGSHTSANKQLHVTTSRLRVTSEDNFWSTMLDVRNSPKQEEKSGLGAMLASLTGSKSHGLLQHLPSLANTVIVLPRIVPQVRNFDPERTPSEDERIWDVPKLAGLVEDFCRLTGASTMPSLAEWSVLPDKKRLHTMYMDYFEADPSSRTPPIPTVFLDTPGTEADLVTLCRSRSLVSSEPHLDATMRLIYEAMINLYTEQQRLQELGVKVDRITLLSNHEEEGQLRHFIIKREFAEGAILVKKIAFPADALPSVNRSAPSMYRGDNPWRARPPLPSRVSEGVRAGGLVTKEPYLKEAAELLTSRGCGEGWLLQLHIIDMPDLEYRVYLFGGAESTGTSKDAVVVYTPSVLDEGLYLANVTLPEGHFWSDIIQAPGGELQDEIDPEEEGVSAKLHQERAPWRNDRLHRKIVDAALSGARAMAAFQDVPLQTVRHMYARMDVVLGVYWGEDGRMYVQTLINEMDWFNSAGVMMRYWPVDFSEEAAAAANGPKLVPAFLRELALIYDASR